MNIINNAKSHIIQDFAVSLDDFGLGFTLTTE